MERYYMSVTVKAMIFINGKILLLKKPIASKDGHGYFELPGGGVQPYESASEAIVREIKEETNLDVIDVEVMYTFNCNRHNQQIIGIGFLCSVKEDTIILSDEHVEYVLATIEEARKYLSKEIFDDVKNYFSKK